MLERDMTMRDSTFTTTGNEHLIDSTETRMNCIISLSDALEFSQQNLIFQVPEMDALRGNIYQCQSARIVTCERHY